MAFLDEEEDEKSAVVRDYLNQKYGPKEPTEREQIEAEIEAAEPAGWRKSLVAASAGFGGRDASSAVKGLYADKEEKRKKLQAFDASQKLKQADAERAIADDPNSEESRTMQALAAKMMPGRDFSKMTATKLKASMPTLEKMYTVEQSRLAREDAARSSADLRNQTRQDRLDLKERERQDKLDREARLSEKQVEGITDFDDSLNKAQMAVTMLGDNDNWTGPIDSKIPDMLVGSNQVGFRSAVGRMADAYRKLITGAGASNAELARLESRMPSLSDTPADFKAKAQSFMEEIKKAKATHLDNYKKSGKNTKEFESSEAPKKTVAKKEFSPSRNQTRITYSDGTQEVVDGQQ